MPVQFKDIEVGVKFTRNGDTFVKIPEEPVNCCTKLNAKRVDTDDKIMVLPLDEVEVVNAGQ